MTDKKRFKQNEWWQSPLGELVSALEQEQIAGLSSPILGFFTIQLGGACRFKPLSNRAANQSWLGSAGDIDALPEALPFKAHSIASTFKTNYLAHESASASLLVK